MFRKYGGKLLIVAAGGGCLALVFFVVAPRLFEPAPPIPHDETVAEDLGTDEQSGSVRQPDERQAEKSELEVVMPVPSPLGGIRSNGAEEEIAEEERGLTQILSAADVAEARAALEGREPEPVEAVEPDATTGIEEEAAVAVAPPVAEAAGAVEAERAELDSTTGREDETPLNALPARYAEAVEKETEAGAVAEAFPAERVSTGGDGRPGNALRLADRKGEFDMPVWSDSRAALEVSHPTGGVPDDAAAGAARAGELRPGSASRTMRAGAIVPGTLRGVMGYRMPLIGRQEVPDQIVSGVLIPAHTTFVILKEGYWELVDVTPEELERFTEAAAKRETRAHEPGPVRRGWSPLRVFRRK